MGNLLKLSDILVMNDQGLTKPTCQVRCYLAAVNELFNDFCRICSIIFKMYCTDL